MRIASATPHPILSERGMFNVPVEFIVSNLQCWDLFSNHLHTVPAPDRVGLHGSGAILGRMNWS